MTGRIVGFFWIVGSQAVSIRHIASIDASGEGLIVRMEGPDPVRFVPCSSRDDTLETLERIAGATEL